VKEESLIYNPQTSFPNNELTDVGLGIKPKSTVLSLIPTTEPEPVLRVSSSFTGF